MILLWWWRDTTTLLDSVHSIFNASDGVGEDIDGLEAAEARLEHIREPAEGARRSRRCELHRGQHGHCQEALSLRIESPSRAYITHDHFVVWQTDRTDSSWLRRDVGAATCMPQSTTSRPRSTHVRAAAKGRRAQEAWGGGDVTLHDLVVANPRPQVR